MPTPLVIPEGVSAEGSVLVKFVPEFADDTNPTLAEANAATALNISCYLDKGSFKPGADVEKWKDERFCTKNVIEQFGAVTYSIDKLVYVYDPQNPTSDSNKAYALMQEGVKGYLLVRWGKDLEDFPDLATGDVVDVYKVELGPQVKQPPESNSRLKVEQEVGGVQLTAVDYALSA